MGWFAAKAYGVEEPPNGGDEGISMDPSAVKPLTVEESVDALVPQVREGIHLYPAFFFLYRKE